MTYCVAIRLAEGLVFCSDSRTHAGTDNVSRYSKLHRFYWPGERCFVLLSAGNLATTQGVLQRLRRDLQHAAQISLLTVPSMDLAADYVGFVNAEVQRGQADRDTARTNFEASFLLGGQIAGEDPAIYLIYPQGNHIHESAEHPFLQIGEVKYGKPILDRVIEPSISLEAAARCALVSMNSTERSNITVGPPIELLLYRRDRLDGGQWMRFDENDPFYRDIADAWNRGLLQALESLPPFPWEERS